MSPKPTSADWARACARVIADAYRMDTGEHGALADDLAAVIDELGLLDDASYTAIPVGVADEASGRRFLGAASELGGPVVRDERVSVEAWADFLSQFLGLSREVAPQTRLHLWQRVTALLSEYEIGERPVRFLSEAMQQALPGPTAPSDAPDA